MGIGLSVLYRQFSVLRRLAEEMTIDFNQEPVYEHVASTFLRFFIVSILFFSLLPGLYVYLPSLREALEALLVGFLIVDIPLVAASLRPLFVMRARIVAAKRECQAQIRSELAALDVGTAEGKAEASYLTIQRMFIESRRDWPVAPHVQWVFLFGLLPPVTWVMAALIENLMFG